MWRASELLEADFPLPRFAVPGIVPEGLSLLVGAPKLGKSWMALNLAIAVASGGRALGQIPVDRGEALYIALEDSPRRLKERLLTVLGHTPAPEGLFFEDDWRALVDGGADDSALWLGHHPDCRLVIVDVLARLRSATGDKADRYMADYNTLEKIKRVADEFHTGVVAVHHTRKAAADDFMDSVSGTHGLAGASDTVLVLKRSRASHDAELSVVGRDVEERQLALRFAPDVGTWTLLGDAAEWEMAETRRRILWALRDARKPLSPKVVSEQLGISHDSAKQTMSRMAKADQLAANGDGTYSPPVTLSPPSPLSLLPTDSVTEVTGVTSLHREETA